MLINESIHLHNYLSICLSRYTTMFNTQLRSLQKKKKKKKKKKAMKSDAQKRDSKRQYPLPVTWRSIFTNWAGKRKVVLIYTSKQIWYSSKCCWDRLAASQHHMVERTLSYPSSISSTIPLKRRKNEVG